MSNLPIPDTGTAVVKFGAEWCGPCRQLDPQLDKFAADNKNIRVISIDVDQQPDLASQNHVMSIPEMMVFKDGELLGRRVGAISAGKISKWVEGLTG